MNLPVWYRNPFVVLGCVLLLAVVFVGYMTKAADVTVCNSGCDYTTITDAINSATLAPGDTISVGNDYASTTETFSFNIPSGVNLDCQNSGAVIGVDAGSPSVTFNSQGDQIIKNCTLSNVQLQSTGVDSVQILNNTFTNRANLTADNSTNITISGNHDVYRLGMNAVETASVTDNNFLTISPENGGIAFNNVTSVVFTGNDLVDLTTSTNQNYQTFTIRNNSYDVYIASSTMSNPYALFQNSGMSQIEVGNSRKIVIRDNFFSYRGIGGGMQSLNLNGSAGNIAVDLEHNTVKLEDPCPNCGGILTNSWNVSDVSVTSSYNLIAASVPSTTANMTGHSSYGAGPSSSLHLYTDHEGFAGLNTLDTTDFPIASNSIVLRYTPFKLEDASTSNDSELVPYSAFLDVNGTEDIGAVPGVRGNSFHISSVGAVDYSAIDASNTLAIMESLRDADTVHIANGDYNPIFLAHHTYPMGLTGNVNIVGSGSGTIIHATTSHALLLTDISDSLFSNLTFTNATSNPATAYKITRAQFTDGVTSYDQGAFIGAPNGVIIITDVPSGGTCSTAFYDADDFNITSIIAATPSSNWNLGLVDYLGLKLTILAPDDYAASAIDFQGCANPGDITVEHFVPNIFTVAGGLYTYNPTAASLAGVTLKSGETNPPRIDRDAASGGTSGIRLNDSNRNQFTHVTSTGNTNGLRLFGASASNRLVESSLSNNENDVLGNSSADNTLIDVNFDHTSTSITGLGSVFAYFTVRGFAKDNGTNAPLIGAPISFTSNNMSSSTTLTTGSDGFTPFSSDPLLAYTLQPAFEGDYNPYTVSLAFPGYTTLSQTTTIGIPFQTVSIALTAAPAGGGSSGGGGLPSTGGSAGIPSTLPSGSSGIPGTTSSFTPGDLIKLPSDGNVETQPDSTVYEVGVDGKRHAFPNPSVYFSRHCDFSAVKIISAQTMQELMLGPNMTYLPGLRLVKFITAPTVYIVQAPNILRPIPDEAAAKNLAGESWNTRISDIGDTFYLDYVIGLPIASNAGLNLTPPACNAYGVLAGEWPLPSIPKTYSFTQMLATGSSGTNVRYLQTVLLFLDNGLFPGGTVTGNYGPATTAAVKRFQASRDISQTGTVGPATRAALNGILDQYR